MLVRTIPLSKRSHITGLQPFASGGRMIGHESAISCYCSATIHEISRGFGYLLRTANTTRCRTEHDIGRQSACGSMAPFSAACAKKVCDISMRLSSSIRSSACAGSSMMPRQRRRRPGAKLNDDGSPWVRRVR
jgi:hypothetical protein